MLQRQIVPLFALVYVSVVPLVEVLLRNAGWYDIATMWLVLWVGFGAVVAMSRARSSQFWVVPYWGAVLFSAAIGSMIVVRMKLSWPWIIPAIVGIMATGTMLFLSDRTRGAKCSIR